MDRDAASAVTASRFLHRGNMRAIGLLLLLLCTLPLAAQGTFTANPGLAIPDNSGTGVSSSITVPPTSDTIYSLRAGVRITHTYEGDLSIWLLPPGVTWAGPYCTPNNGATPTPPAGVIELSTKNGGYSTGYGTGSAGGTVYANFKSNSDPISPSTNPITSGNAPFTSQASWTPEGLTTWDLQFGTNPTGSWTMIVADGWAVDTGTFDSWQLEYVQPPPILNVSAGASNSPGTTIHPGTANQVVGQLTFQSLNSLTLSSLTLQAENGVANNGSFSQVALHEDLNGNGQLDVGDVQVFSGTVSGSSNVTLTAGPPVSFSGAQTRHYLVVADALATPASLGVAYRIVAASNVAVSGTVQGTFPVVLGYHHFGPIHSWGSAPIGGLAIPDNSTTGVTNAITVPTTLDRIGSLRVGIRIDHPRDRELDIFLTPPGGLGQIDLSSDNGGTNSNYGTGAANGPYVYTYFTSTTDPTYPSTAAITGGVAPFTSQARWTPEGLAAWNAALGADPSGAWSLFIRDDSNNRTGTLISWYIEYIALQRCDLAGSASFGSSTVGVTSPGSPQAFTVTNPGEFPLTVSGINFNGTNPTDFAVSPPVSFPTVVPAGGVLNFGVSFTPGAVGARSANLRVISNHNGVPNTVTQLGLTGTGINNGEIDVQRPVSTSIADGGNDPLGTIYTGTPTVFTYTIANVAGAGNLNVTGNITSGSLVNCTALVTQPGVTLLGPGASTTFQVTVNAPAAAAFSFALNIPNDDTNENPYNINVSGNAVNPPFLSATSPVNYGSSNVGVQVGPVGHTITNTGGSSLTITSISIVGTNASDWALISPPSTPLTITVGNNISLQGRFTPSAVGARTAQLRLVSNHTGVPSTVTLITLQGTGTQAAASVVTPVNYGNRNVGVASAAVGHTLTNTGSGPMTITAVSVGGDWVLSGVPSLPATIAPAGTFNFNGVFTPAATGARNATIQINWNQGGGVGATSVNIAVTGNGTLGVIGVTSPVNYGSSNVGVATAAQGHTINNTGSGPMTITSITPTGDWTISGTPSLPVTVAAGGSFNFSGIFTPAAVGARAGTFVIAWNQGGGVGATNTNINVTGNGTQATIGVTTPVNYGSSNLGIAAPSQNHVVNNTGSGPMTITAISVSAGDWVLNSLPGLPATVPFGNNVNFNGVFTPTALGARTATISVSWNQGGGVSPVVTTIIVNGTGTQGVLSVTTPVNYGSSNIGVSTAATNHTLNNIGGGPLQITAITLGGSHPGDWSLGSLPGLPATVSGGGNVSFNGTFTPAATGARIATVTVTWNQGAGSTNTVITLNGNGTQATIGVTTPVSYGSSNVGISAAPVNHVVTNSGSGPMTITAITPTGDWAFQTAPSLPVTIPALGSMNFNGVFTPSATGARSGAFTVFWNQGSGVGATNTPINVTGNGTQATISVTTPINSGSSNIGVSATPVNHVVTNTGSGPMTITAITPSGDWAFQTAPSLPVTIPALGSMNFNGVFTPSATGARSGAFTVSWNQGSGVGATNTPINVTGDGTVAAINITTPVSYGSRNVGVPTSPVNHIINNTGSGPMRITSIVATGDWSVANLPSLPAVVNSLGNTNFDGIFTPTAVGARNGTLDITWDQGAGVGSTMTSIVVTGTGTLGGLSVTSPVDYGDSNIGITVGPLSHVCTNSGTGAIFVRQVALGGSNPGDWALTSLPTYNVAVAPSSTFNIGASFTPTAAGARQATIDVTWDQGTLATTTVTSITVGGNGTFGNVTLSNNGNYGNIAAGLSSSPVTHTITNTGTGPARITNVSTAGADAAFWSLSSTPPTNQIITASGTWNFQGQFSPNTVRSYSAQLVIDWDNGAGTASQQTSIALSGNGVPPSSVVAVSTGADNGGPIRVQGDVIGPTASLVDVTVTYTGGTQGGTPAPAFISSVVGGYSIVANTIFSVPEGTTLVFYWDAYANEGHTTASDYVITLSPAISGVPGVPGSSPMFTLSRSGGWTKYVAASDVPGPVSEQAMIRDVANDRLVAFGGYRGAALTNEVWEFVYATNSWRKLTPAGTPPSPRREAPCIYDAANNRMIIFGGASPTGVTNTTHALSLTPGAESWTQIATSSPATPSVRTHGTLVLDAASNRAILYGGYNGSVLQDVWALSLTPGSESWGTGALTTVNSPYAQSIGNAAIYDPVAQRMLVYRPYTSELYEMTLGATPTWTNLTPSGTPSFARYPAVAYDSLRHAMVLQGGLATTSTYSTAWSLDIASLTWTQLPDEPNSGGRFWHTGAYDEIRDQLVVLGGRDYARVQNSTMGVLSLAPSPTWISSPAAISDAAGPNARRGAVLVNDALNNRVLLFGGGTSDGLMNDLWALDRTTPGPWVRLTATGTLPSARAYAASCYDSINNRVILFGGESSSGKLNDVWTLDVATLTWQLHSIGTGPSPRSRTSIAYEPAGNRVLLFAGSTSAPNNEYWEYAFGAGWTQPTTTGTPPSARFGHGGVYDSGNNRFVIFCGENASVQTNDVWELDLSMGTPAWTDISAVGTSPLVRTRFAMAATPAGDTVYVSGGKRTYAELGDTWRLDLSGAVAVWTQVATNTGNPTERFEHAGCLDNAGRLVIGTGNFVGKQTNDVWEIDFGLPTPAYVQLAVPSAPPNLAYSQAAYDPVGNRMIVFGGTVNNAHHSGLWQLDLSATPPAWSLLNAAGSSPVARNGASFVYDSMHSPPRMILYGGRASYWSASWLNDVWTLELTPGAEQWVKLNTTGNNGNRAWHSAVMDGSGNMVVFAGSNRYGGPSNDVIRLNLTTLSWTFLATSGTAPSARLSHSAVYDGLGGRDRMLVYGGNAYGTNFDDLWELNLSTLTWTQLNPAGPRPPGLQWTSLVVDPAAQRLLLYGGSTPTAYGELFSFDLAGNTWTPITPPGVAPQARWGHSAVWDTTGNRMVVVGGLGGSDANQVPLSEQAGVVADTWYWGD